MSTKTAVAEEIAHSRRLCARMAGRDRRHAPLDRGNRRRDHRSLQGASTCDSSRKVVRMLWLSDETAGPRVDEAPAAAALLQAAGSRSKQSPAEIDERALEEAAQGDRRRDHGIALELARAKGDAVSAPNPGRLVVGADQTLALGADALSQARRRGPGAARQSPSSRDGRTRCIRPPASVPRWRSVFSSRVRPPALTMRPFSAAMIETYLDAAGAAVLRASAAYQLEGWAFTCSNGSKAITRPFLACRSCLCSAFCAAPARVAVIGSALLSSGSQDRSAWASPPLRRCSGSRACRCTIPTQRFTPSIGAPRSRPSRLLFRGSRGKARSTALNCPVGPGRQRRYQEARSHRSSAGAGCRQGFPAEGPRHQRAARRSRHSPPVRDRRRRPVRCGDRGFRAGGCAKAARAGPRRDDPGAVSGHSRPADA